MRSGRSKEKWRWEQSPIRQIDIVAGASRVRRSRILGLYGKMKNNARLSCYIGERRMAWTIHLRAMMT